jgi:hypothetical protein
VPVTAAMSGHPPTALGGSVRAGAVVVVVVVVPVVPPPTFPPPILGMSQAPGMT